METAGAVIAEAAVRGAAGIDVCAGAAAMAAADVAVVSAMATIREVNNFPAFIICVLSLFDLDSLFMLLLITYGRDNRKRRV